MVNFYVTGENGKLEKTEKFGEFCWVDMVNPTDDECEEIVSASGVGEDMLKAALDEEERARAEFDNGFSMFIVDCPIIEDDSGG